MKTSGGFTLVELVMILIMVGILAVTATPRMFNRQTFDTRAFFDQTQAMLRYGQKVAIGQQRPVFFNANAGNGAVCLTFVADADCASASGVPNPADGASFRRTAPDGVSLSASVSFSFTSLGQPFPDAPVTFGIVGDNTTRTITVERETGYVH